MTLLSRFVLLFLLANGSALAQDVGIIGGIEQSIKQTQPNTNLKFNAQSDTNTTITLLKIELSEHAQRAISQRVDQALQSNQSAVMYSNAPASASQQKQLGMNNVPVLNQGQFGTCTTFAVTAAMDAFLGKGDYISQLCSLQLGNNLAKTTNQLSGWNGAFAQTVFAQFKTFGIFSQANQKKYGCGGLTTYPSWSIPTTDMSPDLYYQHSESLDNNGIAWSSLLTQNQVFLDTTDMDTVVSDVKNALNTGHRVTFSVLLPRTDLGTGGAVGWHHYLDDTWMLTTDISNEIKSHKTLPGHEMVITGYDDRAVSMDTSGHRHHGLFTLRNSWGAYVADWGDFYMTYDYFKALALEAQQVTPLTNKN